MSYKKRVSGDEITYIQLEGINPDKFLRDFYKDASLYVKDFEKELKHNKKRAFKTRFIIEADEGVEGMLDSFEGSLGTYHQGNAESAGFWSALLGLGGGGYLLGPPGALAGLCGPVVYCLYKWRVGNKELKRASYVRENTKFMKRTDKHYKH